MNFGNIPVKKRLNSSLHYSRILHQIGFSLFKIILIFLISFLIIGTVSIVGMLHGILDSSPDIASINMEPTGYTTKIYDANGNITASLDYQDQARQEVSISSVPDYLIQAFILMEDPNFFYHKGTDLKQFLRQLISNFSNERSLDNIGTITQQLIRNNIFNGGVKKSFGEKLEQIIQESSLALQLEKQMNKTEILEFYLNSINLGNNSLGIQAAAIHYFNKNVSELTLSECSVLAAAAYNPSLYNPLKQQTNNEMARKQLLDKMLTAQIISNAEYQEALADNVYVRLQTAPHTNLITAPILSYYNEEVVNSVLSDLQNNLGYSETQAYNLVYYGGISIYTPMRTDIQKIVDEELNSPKNYPQQEFSLSYTLVVSHPDGSINTYSESDIKNYQQTVLQNSDFRNVFSNENQMNQSIQLFKESVVHNEDKVLDETIKTIPQPQASMVLLNQKNGYVLALSGGRGERLNNLNLNRASESLHQPGSAFSVLSSFAPSLDISGATLASTYYDSPFQVADQTFVNRRNETYMGYTTIHQAIEFSMNTVAAKTLSKSVTPAISYDYLSQFNFSSLVPEDKSINLSVGNLTNGVTNLELTTAYAAIANGGVYTEPIFYTKIVDRNGKTILEKEYKTSLVMKETTASLLTHVLEDNVSGDNYWDNYNLTLNGKHCLVPDMSIAGQSGTSFSTGDNWFIGYSPYITCGIWSGYDDSKIFSEYNPYHKIIWQKVMEQAHSDLSDPGFFYSDELDSAKICSKSGLLAIEGICDHETSNSVVYTEWFEKGTIPTQYCNRHTKVNICTGSHMKAGGFCPRTEEIVYLLTDNKDFDGQLTEDSKHILPNDLLKSSCDMHTSPKQ